MHSTQPHTAQWPRIGAWIYANRGDSEQLPIRRARRRSYPRTRPHGGVMLGALARSVSSGSPASCF
ncbi:hypothetical protein MIC448_460065 [Microbacterium sp. C448]|nr:hypothetical protein MIC448_460065 [Microbacterium sp. C448]